MTEEVYRDRVPLALCRDKGFHVATRLVSQEHDPVRARTTSLHTQLERALDNVVCAHDRDSRSRVTIELSCRDTIESFGSVSRPWMMAQRARTSVRGI